jgi:hypothetical protein
MQLAEEKRPDATSCMRTVFSMSQLELDRHCAEMISLALPEMEMLVEYVPLLLKVTVPVSLMREVSTLTVQFVVDAGWPVLLH